MENINEYHKSGIKFAPSGREFYGEETYQRIRKILKEVDKRLSEKEAIKKVEREEPLRLSKSEKDKKDSNNSDECRSNR